MNNYEETQLVAYRLWEEEGRPCGKDTDHWLRAEAIVLNRKSGNGYGGATPGKAEATPRAKASWPSASHMEPTPEKAKIAPTTKQREGSRTSTSTPKRKAK